MNPVPRATHDNEADKDTGSLILPFHLLLHYKHTVPELAFLTVAIGTGIKWPHPLPITRPPVLVMQ